MSTSCQLRLRVPGAGVAVLLSLVCCLCAQGESKPQVVNPELRRVYPFSAVGQLLVFDGSTYYVGTATAIGPNAALTAAHNLWDARLGWSPWIRFDRGREGETYFGRRYASSQMVLGGYQTAGTEFGQNSSRAFERDMGGIRFRKSTNPAEVYSRWLSSPQSLSTASFNIALGYGAEVHTGNDLLFVAPSFSFYQVFGGYYANDSMFVEHGMSGGPVFAQDSAGNYGLVGIIVSGTSLNTDSGSTGVRAIDERAAQFIRAYLQ